MDEVKKAADGFCPYVGLQPYGEVDQDYFFGRDRESRIISSNLYAAPLTILYGASGVGKSSVLRAGVMPRLRASPRTAVVIFDGWADKNLLNTLKAQCLKAIAATTGREDFQLDVSLPLDEFLFSATRALDGMFFILLDQFEEYFLYHPETEKDNPFDAEFALSVNREEIDVNFLVALREDTLSKLDRFRARIPNMFGNSLRLRHLDAASAREAIREPLEVYGRQYPDEPRVSVEDALVEELINEIRVEKLIIGQGGRGVFEEAGAAEESEVRIETPFLQLVLTRLWDEEINRQESHVLRLETLHALGGAARIVQTHMDEAMNTLSLEEQETAASIFRYMVTPSGTKIAYTIADLEYYAKTDQPLRPVLEKLAHGDARIMSTVTLPGEPGIVRYQIYHDVLAPAVLDWRSRYENGKQLLSLFYLLIEKDDPDRALQVYQEMVEQTPQQAFLPERFQIRKIFGRSDLGVSYLVFDQEENRLVTATILWNIHTVEEENLVQFAAQMRGLSSPRISRFLGLDRHHDNIYILTEYVEGANLRMHLRQGRPLPYAEAMKIAAQVAEALEDGHEQGIPHLDLRPSHVMLSPDGVKLVSYGFSRLTFHGQDGSRPVMGYSFDYLAPEQLAGKEGDERSDIYALGTILYQMLTGHTPVGRFQSPSEVNVEATEAVDVLIDHARERDPERRFTSAREMRTEIGRISLREVRGNLNQIIRIILSRISRFYERLTSRKFLLFLLSGLAALLALSIDPDLTVGLLLPARLLFPLLLNSVVVSILADWIVRTIARRRGLGSLIASGSGMGAVLGLLFTLNQISSVGFEAILKAPDIPLGFAGMLAVALFETAFVLGIILAIARAVERIFKSYTIGFYSSFVAIVVIVLVLTILRQPPPIFEP